MLETNRASEDSRSWAGLMTMLEGLGSSWSCTVNVADGTDLDLSDDEDDEDRDMGDNEPDRVTMLEDNKGGPLGIPGRAEVEMSTGGGGA